MAVITSLPSRVGGSFRKFMVMGVAIGAVTGFVIRYTIFDYYAYRSAMFTPPDHIAYFPHGEKGYLKGDYCIDNADTEECCNPYHCTQIVNRSTLYSECCGRVHNDDKTTTTRKGTQRSKMLPLLITSAPRSGTRFIQQLFTKVGMSGLTTDLYSPQYRGTVSWKHVFDDEHYIAGKAHTHLYQSKFRVIWHLVRDPLSALTSLAFTEPLLENDLESTRYVNYIAKHVHLSDNKILREFFKIDDNDWENRVNGTYNENIHKFLVYRGMEIYLHWHGFINHLNVPVFRLEDLSVDKNVTVLDEVFYSVGMTPPRHVLVKAFLDAQEEKQNDWRQLTEGSSVHRRQRGTDVVNGGIKVELHKNARDHRETLTWAEVCDVNKRKARALLTMSQSFGYYPNLDAETLCAKADPTP